jgi:hypothetical protein
MNTIKPQTSGDRHDLVALTSRIIHAMDKRVYNKIVRNNKQQELFDKISAALGMTTFDNFWDDYIKMKDERFPTPSFITVYKARFEHGFTQQVLQSLAQDGLMRTNGSKPPLYALEDIELMKKIRNIVGEFRDENILQRVQTKKGPKYSIDIAKKGMSADKYNGEILKKLTASILGDMYTIIPKNLSLEQQIDLLKQQFVDKK